MGLLDDLKMGFGLKDRDDDYNERTAATMERQRKAGKRRFQSTPSNSSGQNPFEGLLSMFGGSKKSDPNNTEDLGLGGLKSFFGNRENAPKTPRGDAMIRATMEDKLPGYFDPMSRRYVPWYEDMGNKGFFNGAGDAGDIGIPTPMNLVGGLLGRDPAREGEYRTSQGDYEDYLTYGNPQPAVRQNVQPAVQQNVPAAVQPPPSTFLPQMRPNDLLDPRGDQMNPPLTNLQALMRDRDVRNHPRFAEWASSVNPQFSSIDSDASTVAGLFSDWLSRQPSMPQNGM
tara:strand:- start:100 stop:954 length:855 start_codon:yes stop_codon:yes gene_type:complete